MPDHSIPTLVRKAPGYLLKQLGRRYIAWRLSRYFELHPDHRALDEERARSALRDADQVLFLCWGNICRSPMAERTLGVELDGDTELRVRSAGLGRYEGRESPSDAVTTARRYGVDLADHRSRQATEPLVAASDVMFFMDYNDYHAVTERFPEAERRAFFLGIMADGGESQPTIPDPHGEGPRAFEGAYGHIVSAVESVADEIESGDEP
jgi:protein-tyrosine phosphatase